MWSFIVLYWKGDKFGVAHQKDTENSSIKLPEPLVHKVCILWMANYNYLALAEFLKSCNASCVKTIKIQRQAVPVKIKATEGHGYQAAWWLCMRHQIA